MKFAVDLLWVRPNQVGGIESYIRNLLTGIMGLSEKFNVVLILSKDNADSFHHYLVDSRFAAIKCPIESKNIKKRIIWQNLHLSKILRKIDIDVCFEPVYSKPIFNFYNIKFITTIHDLQALHYPEYQSKIKVLWMKFCWWNTVRSSEKVITISEFVRQDIINTYLCAPEKIIKIYNPVMIDKNEMIPFEKIQNKYGIKKSKYFYTVSSLLPHKNLITLIKVIKYIVEKKIDLPDKLLISGVGGRLKDEVLRRATQYNIKNNIILTDFLPNTERNALYINCRAFLFPSIFEGFGMPPIEAMMVGCDVVTTKNTSIYEVTKGKANYVDDPFDEKDWIEKINQSSKNEYKIIKGDFEEYNLQVIAGKYLNELKREADNK